MENKIDFNLIKGMTSLSLSKSNNKEDIKDIEKTIMSMDDQIWFDTSTVFREQFMEIKSVVTIENNEFASVYDYFVSLFDTKDIWIKAVKFRNQLGMVPNPTKFNLKIERTD